MKYHVRLGTKMWEVEVEGGRVVVGGQAREAHIAHVPNTPLYHVLLGGESWTVAAQPLDGLGDGGGSRWAVGVAGERIEVEAVDDRTRQIQALTGSRHQASGGTVLKAPMPGLVVRIEVTAGQRIPAGAPLVVVEAMKMENELRASRGGIVQAIHVAPGTAVEKGTVLVTLAPEESQPSS